MTNVSEVLRGWLSGRLPEDWFTAPVDVRVDREEITITGTLTTPNSPDASDAEREAAVAGRIKAFRESTRDERIAIARELEQQYRRKVAWAVDCGDTHEVFSNVAVPVMTRLRQPDRQVLDTLVASGVARSRADALAWCVRLVGRHEDDWLAALRDAMRSVDEVKSQGPSQKNADVQVN